MDLLYNRIRRNDVIKSEEFKRDTIDRGKVPGEEQNAVAKMIRRQRGCRRWFLSFLFLS